MVIKIHRVHFTKHLASLNTITYVYVQALNPTRNRWTNLVGVTGLNGSNAE